MNKFTLYIALLIFSIFASNIANSSEPINLIKENLNINKVVIITGASKGIGKGIAKAFAKENYTVILVSRNLESLSHFAQDLISQGYSNVDVIAADVSNENDMKNMAKKVYEKYKRIDVLAHNAGIYPFAKIENMTSKEWHQVIETNLTSAFYTTTACLPYMKKQNPGRILFTSSISGPRVGLPGASHYTASKAGLNGFMKTIAIELAKYNITANAIEPGNIATEGLEELGEEHKANMAKAVPLGRLGTIEDVANAFIFLASEKASYITGQSIIVDGGQTLPESHYLLTE
ncbi:MAG: SDR family oxidoreductase [Alphaproteobacteria bacterium]